MTLVWIFLASVSLADEPNRIIEHAAVELFIESQRKPDNGPGVILAYGTHDYDGDSHPDRLVVYSFEHGPNPGDKSHEMYAVAFLTENFETTEVLVISGADMVPFSLEGYSSAGNELVIRGKKYLSGDAMCCPSAETSITLAISNAEVVILKNEYRPPIDRR